MTNQSTYFEYLRRRSRFGLIYRKYWLYPRLNRYLNGKTLDVGCGIGDLLAFRENTVGVDINIKMVEWCCSQGYVAEIMEVDKLPFSDGNYDSIVMDNVLEHIEKPEFILTEVHRVLVNGGVFLLGVPGSLGYTKDSDHKVFYSKDKLVETICKFGFIEKKIFAMPLNLKWLDKRLSQYSLYGVFCRIENNQ